MTVLFIVQFNLGFTIDAKPYIAISISFGKHSMILSAMFKQLKYLFEVLITMRYSVLVCSRYRCKSTTSISSLATKNVAWFKPLATLFGSYLSTGQSHYKTPKIQK